MNENSSLLETTNEELEIPKHFLEKIEKYSKRLGIPRKSLEIELVEYYKEYKLKYPRRTSQWQMAHDSLRGRLRREEGSYLSSALAFKGYLFGESYLDWIEVRKNKALAMYNDLATRDEAIRQGLVSEDGTPLDNRPYIWYKGRQIENPDYGKPFDPDRHEHYRALYGIAAYFDSEDYKFVKINCQNELAMTISYEFYEPLKFRCTVKTDNPYFVLNSTKVTKFIPIELELDLDYIIRNCGWTIHPLHKIEKLFMSIGKDRQNPILIEAVVTNIGTEINPKTGNRKIYLDDEELDISGQGIPMFINGEFPLEFGEDDRIIVLGSLDKLGAGTSKETIIINADGILPLAQYRR